MNRAFPRFCIAAALVAAGVLLSGCQGYDYSAKWIGDGNSDPNEDRALSDRPGFGSDTARLLEKSISGTSN